MSSRVIAPLRTPHRAWWVVAAAAFAIVAAGAFTTMSGLLVAPLHREFGWSHGLIGAAVSVNMVLYGVTAPFAAALMDRLGVRRVVTGALVMVAAGALATTALTAPWQFVLCWGVLVGLGTGAMAMAFAATVAARWFHARRGLVTGLLTASGVVGQFAFLPVLSGVAEHAHWRAALWAVALVAIGVAPIAWAVLRDHPADVGLAPYGAAAFEPKPPVAPGAARRGASVLLWSTRTRAFWVLAGMFAICGASTNGIMWSHFVPAAQHHGMAATAASSLLAVIGVCNVAGTVSAGWLTDRVDARWLLGGLFLARAVTLVSLPSLLGATAGPSLVAFAVVFGVLDVATVPPTIAVSSRRYGRDGAIVFGWINAAHQLGAGAMAAIGGLTRDLTGSHDLIWILAAALCLVATALVAGLGVHGRSALADQRF